MLFTEFRCKVTTNFWYTQAFSQLFRWKTHFSSIEVHYVKDQLSQVLSVRIEHYIFIVFYILYYFPFCDQGHRPNHYRCIPESFPNHYREIIFFLLTLPIPFYPAYSLFYQPVPFFNSPTLLKLSLLFYSLFLFSLQREQVYYFPPLTMDEFLFLFIAFEWFRIFGIFGYFLTLMEMTSLMTGFILNGLSESLLSSRLFRIKA